MPGVICIKSNISFPSFIAFLVISVWKIAVRLWERYIMSILGPCNATSKHLDINFFNKAGEDCIGWSFSKSIYIVDAELSFPLRVQGQTTVKIPFTTMYLYLGRWHETIVHSHTHDLNYLCHKGFFLLSFDHWSASSISPSLPGTWKVLMGFF